MHVMKALASHPSAAQSLIEDESLQLLFEMVANGPLTVFVRFKEGLVPLHNIQLHRHAMQVNEVYMSSYIFSQSNIERLPALTISNKLYDYIVELCHFYFQSL